MRISELQNKLAEIKEEFGNCHVVIADETQPDFRVISNFSVENAFVEDQSGDVHEVVSLRIPAEKAVDGENDDCKRYVQRVINEYENLQKELPKVLFCLNEAIKKDKESKDLNCHDPDINRPNTLNNNCEQVFEEIDSSGPLNINITVNLK